MASTTASVRKLENKLSLPPREELSIEKRMARCERAVARRSQAAAQGRKVIEQVDPEIRRAAGVDRPRVSRRVTRDADGLSLGFMTPAQARARLAKGAAR